MTQSEVNRILTEKVLGKCWHEYPEGTDMDNCIPTRLSTGGLLRWEVASCIKCKEQSLDHNPDFSQWPDYGPLLEKIQGEGYWRELAYRESAQGCFRESLLNPTRGSLAIAEFVVNNPQIFGEVK